MSKGPYRPPRGHHPKREPHVGGMKKIARQSGKSYK